MGITKHPQALRQISSLSVERIFRASICTTSITTQQIAYKWLGVGVLGMPEQRGPGNRFKAMLEDFASASFKKLSRARQAQDMTAPFIRMSNFLGEYCHIILRTQNFTHQPLTIIGHRRGLFLGTRLLVPHCKWCFIVKNGCKYTPGLSTSSAPAAQ